MSRFATAPAAAPTRTPWSIGTNPAAASTFEAGAGFTPSDPHLELFNAAVSGMLADGFYESGDNRVDRIVELVARCDPDWLRPFAGWLRSTANMRSAPIVIAAEYARHGWPAARTVVADAIRRADEPGEMLGYWLSRYGRNVPSRVKRGVADAVTRLYGERSLARYDGHSKGWRFGDVIEFVHPTPKAPWQSDLFRYALDRRRHPGDPVPESLAELAATARLEALPVADRRAHLDEAVAAGFSWERVAGWLPDGMDRDAWTALTPTLGYMALLRNLNNFDRHGVDPAPVIARLVDEQAVHTSKLLPFRFLTAYMALEADTYKVPLETVAGYALANLPEFGGRTLIMVDCSESMSNPAGAGKSRLPLALSRVAAFMAEAIARRCTAADIVCYDEQIIHSHAPARHVGVLRASADPVYSPRGGTYTWTCTARAFAGHDRVIILTDEQAHDSDNETINAPVVTWNLAGYQVHQAAHGKRNRYLIAGYSDTAMQMLPAVMRVGDGHWPWD